MKSPYIFLVSVFFFTSYAYGSEIETYFSPSPDCEKHITDYIDNTNQSLDIMIYSFTSEKIVDAIYRAFERGVKIRMIVDRVQAASKHSQIREMQKRGIDMRVKNGSGIMHNKVAIFDRKMYLTGSYNWTHNAGLRNDENCLFVRDNPETLKLYQDKMDELWQKYRPY